MRSDKILFDQNLNFHLEIDLRPAGGRFSRNFNFGLGTRKWFNSGSWCVLGCQKGFSLKCLLRNSNILSIFPKKMFFQFFWKWPYRPAGGQKSDRPAAGRRSRKKFDFFFNFFKNIFLKCVSCPENITYT